MADPEQYRTKEEVAQWRERDPIPSFAALLEREGLITPEQQQAIDADASARVDAAVQFAEASPSPAPESLYDDVYVLDQAVRGTYSVRTTDPAAHPAEDAQPDGPADEIPQQMTDALLMGEDASMLGGEP
jgi:pyruvate dehydrogenase E1 component alpha subunit